MEKQDMTPLNKEQIKAIKEIIEHCTCFVDIVTNIMNKCPGLLDKRYEVEVDIDPRFLKIGKGIKIHRNLVKDGEIIKERYVLQRGYDKFDNGWEEDEALCTKEFARLFNGKADAEGTGEGSSKEYDVLAVGLSDRINVYPHSVSDMAEQVNEDDGLS